MAATSQPGPQAPPQALVQPMRAVLRALGVGALVALPVAGLVGWLVAGAPGVWGAVIGLALPALFLGLTVVLALRTARLQPSALGAVVLGSWVVKLAVLVVALALLDRWDGWHRPTFFVAFLLGTVGWLVGEALVVVRTRVPYVEAR